MPCPLCGATLHPTAIQCRACGAVSARKQSALSLAIGIGGAVLLASGLVLAFAMFTAASLGQVVVGTAMVLAAGRFRKTVWVRKG